MKSEKQNVVHIEINKQKFSVKSNHLAISKKLMGDWIGIGLQTLEQFDISV